MNINNADSIKAGFILETINGNITIFSEPIMAVGQEVMFGKNNSLADLLIIYKDKLYAFEIKAYRDNFRRLNTQLSNYKKVFDYVYLVITPNHYKSLTSGPCDRIGLIVVDEKEFSIVKKAKIQKSLSKEDILETLPLSFLKKNYKYNNRTTAAFARKTLTNKSMKELKKLLLEYMKNKINYKYKNFLAEKGDTVQYEDISILSLMDLSVLK